MAWISSDILGWSSYQYVLERTWHNLIIIHSAACVEVQEGLSRKFLQMLEIDMENTQITELFAFLSYWDDQHL